ncbi:YbaY family lipoprotein [Pseudomaricurvus sp.]|uniref:YbaY family lipoprotein n=1 Tax=Pseudomaricurvus sp. TaxID=2004510 RepID=UPI003F6AD571
MIRLCALMLSIIVTFGCSEEAEHPEAPAKPVENVTMKTDNTLMRVITGEVWYRERMALPPGTKVRVVLEDQSKMDAPAETITEYTHVVDGSGPYTYRLVYNPSAIKERMRYGLRARIEKDGALMFTSTGYIDPFAVEPGTNIKIMVTRVQQAEAE